MLDAPQLADDQRRSLVDVVSSLLSGLGVPGFTDKQLVPLLVHRQD